MIDQLGIMMEIPLFYITQMDVIKYEGKTFK